MTPSKNDTSLRDRLRALFDTATLAELERATDQVVGLDRSVLVEAP